MFCLVEPALPNVTTKERTANQLKRLPKATVEELIRPFLLEAIANLDGVAALMERSLLARREQLALQATKTSSKKDKQGIGGRRSAASGADQGKGTESSASGADQKEGPESATSGADKVLPGFGRGTDGPLTGQPCAPTVTEVDPRDFAQVEAIANEEDEGGNQMYRLVEPALPNVTMKERTANQLKRSPKAIVKELKISSGKKDFV
jgi:hypothetical protein